MIQDLRGRKASGATSKLSTRSMKQRRKPSHNRFYMFAASRKLSLSVKVVFMFAALNIFCCNVARAQIAPGPLSRAHEDPHKGQFAAGTDGSDCSACHSSTSFKPPLFGREAHMKSSFPLVGKHSTLPCVKCHVAEGREAQFKIGNRLCQECHAEPHGGEFASEPYSNKCDLCHTEAGFEVTTFSRERHVQTRFPLTGSHTEVACNKCHKPLTPAVSKVAKEIEKVSFSVSPLEAADKRTAPSAQRQYHFASRACDTCHTDPHGISPQANLSCETCHTPQEWKALLPFDHSRTRSRLEGPHKAVAQAFPCIMCHNASVQVDRVAAGTAPVFSGTTMQCSKCHVGMNPHGGQFSSPANRQKDCSSCHIPKAWNAGGFDHDSSGFILSSAHSKATCVKCHKEQKDESGGIVRVYRNTPADCLKCH
jgi:hypothetical protein